MTASAQSSSSTTALSSTQDITAQQVSTAAVILISICDSLSLTWQIYAEAESNASLLAIAEARQYMRAGCVGKMLTAGSHIGT